MYEHEMGMATLQEAVAMMEKRGQELQESCHAWEERYAALQSQCRSEQAMAAAKCQGLEMERDEFRLQAYRHTLPALLCRICQRIVFLQVDAARAECAAAHINEEVLQAQVLQLRSERTDSMLQNEINHETEMDRLRELLSVASNKEASLIDEVISCWVHFSGLIAGLGRCRK